MAPRQTQQCLTSQLRRRAVNPRTNSFHPSQQIGSLKQSETAQVPCEGLIMKFSIFMMPLHQPSENHALAFDRDISLIHLADELAFDAFFIAKIQSGG